MQKHVHLTEAMNDDSRGRFRNPRVAAEDAPRSPFKMPTAKAETYPYNRRSSFIQASTVLQDDAVFSTDRAQVCLGDSLSLLRRLPSHSIDLVLTDPPYHSTKKANIYGDSDFEHDDHFIEWIMSYVHEWKRLLRPNGSIYMFCSSDMAPYLYVAMSAHMNMHSIITWTKPNEPGYDGWKQKMNKTALRRWYPHSERIIFCSPAAEGNLKRSPVGLFLRECRLKAEMSSNYLTEVIGAYGRVNNGGAVSNWETGRNIPSRDQYDRIAKAFVGTGKIGIMPEYEDIVRAFNIDPSLPFVDSWDFMNVRQYKGKHPAEKPQDLLAHIIRTSSYPEDVVLDCFSGSGATVAAALQLGRQAIGIEIDPDWAEYSTGYIRRTGLTDSPKYENKKDNIKTLPLFAG